VSTYKRRKTPSELAMIGMRWAIGVVLTALIGMVISWIYFNLDKRYMPREELAPKLQQIDASIKDEEKERRDADRRLWRARGGNYEPPD